MRSVPMVEPCCRFCVSMLRQKTTSQRWKPSVPAPWMPEASCSKRPASLANYSPRSASMLKRLGFLAVAGLAVVLSGCAHSPQQLNVTPSVTIPLSQVARQQPVVLTVQDSRSSPVMGTRGGLYPDSSNLTISNQAVPHLRQQVEQALGKLGFQVVPEGTPNANSLVVS